MRIDLRRPMMLGSVVCDYLLVALELASGLFLGGVDSPSTAFST